MKIKTTLILIIISCFGAYGQSSESARVAIPFLTIKPDARSTGMGGVGVATSTDNYSIFHNAAKMSRLKGKYNISASYTPWMRSIPGNDDMYLSNINGYYKIDKLQSVGVSLRNFSLGEFTLRQNVQEIGQTTKMTEFAIDIAYSRVLSDYLSMAINFKFINSDRRTPSGSNGITEMKSSYAADVSVFFSKEYHDDLTWSCGLRFDNIGRKIRYGKSYHYLPASINLGTGVAYKIDKNNCISGTVEFSRLMVKIETGEENVSGSTMGNIFGSFSNPDVLSEVKSSIGFEYAFKNELFARAGYHYESDEIGGLNYTSIGLGYKYKYINADFSYWITESSSPLKNTFRFSVGINLDKLIR